MFQPAPKTAEDIEAAKPLDISPDEVLEYDEETWYAKVYRGDDIPQFTFRAVFMGSMLGFLLAFTNLYIGLKTGWGLGVAITACILAYAIWSGMLKVGLAKTPMTILETNCMQSTASSAGYATGGTMVSAIAALLMLSATETNPAGTHITWPVLTIWTLFLAMLGTVLAIPMKRNMINKERLKFPSGTAAAVTLQSLYSSGETALRKARALMVSAAIGAVVPLLLELNIVPRLNDEGVLERGPRLPADSALFDWLPARGAHLVDGELVQNKPSDWTLVMDHNPVMIAAGAIVGMRVALWMVLGGVALAYLVGPPAYDAEWTSEVTGRTFRAASQPYKAWKEIGIWFGVPIMVSYGLLSFAMQWRTIVRAFSGLRGGGDEDELVQRTEVPFRWFAVVGSISAIGVIAIAHVYFFVPWYYGILAVAFTFLLSLVACRATGESDITPVGAMGKIMQLTYGVLIPQSMTANLMTASITASAAGSSADLLNDLKSGYLLGANPRRQFFAQFAGIFPGTVATVFGFYLLVPDATALNGVGSQAPKFPAPAAQAWKAVAEVFQVGFANMHPMHQQAIYAGLALGALLLALEVLLPKVKGYLPSATGLGLGLILPFQYPLSMFLGALAAWLWMRRDKVQAEEYVVPLSAGLIAGISIMGVLVAILNVVIVG